MRLYTDGGFSRKESALEAIRGRNDDAAVWVVPDEKVTLVLLTDRPESMVEIDRALTLAEATLVAEVIEGLGLVDGAYAAEGTRAEIYAARAEAECRR